MICWFKQHENEDWQRGEIVHWATMSEKICDYAYSEPSAVVRSLSGWFHVVPCKFLFSVDFGMGQSCPEESIRPEIDIEELERAAC